MIKNYWIIKLRVSTLLKVLREKSQVEHLTYIEVTKPAKLLLRILQKINRITSAVHKIPPRYEVAGPVLNLSEVRNEKGEVITQDIYHRILAVRKKSADYFFKQYKGFSFVTRHKKLFALYAYFALRIAEDVLTAIYLGYFAQWKYHNPEINEADRACNILIIPDTYWTEMVKEELELAVDQVVIQRPEGRMLRKMRVFKHLVKTFLVLGPARVFRSLKKSIPLPAEYSATSNPRQTHNATTHRVMVNYSMGLTKGQRTDIAFFHDSDLKAEQLMVYCQVESHLPNEKELAWMTENKVHSIANWWINKPLPGVKKRRPTPALKILLKDFYALYLRTVSECCSNKNQQDLWLMDIFWNLGTQAADWKDFFLANNVGTIVNLTPSETNFIPTYAISETGGFSIECERSILFDYCTFIHNPPNHISFISGPYSLTQIPEPSLSLQTIQAGMINFGNTHSEIEGLMPAAEGKFIITIFDENSNDVFHGHSIREMYEAMLDLLDEDERFFLLIKTKKPIVLQKLPDIDKRLQRYCDTGRSLLADWKVSASNASLNANLVVTAPSTAAFEGALSGTPTIVYNPMRSGSKVFYRKNGLNRRIFEDSDAMKNAIKRLANGEDNTVGECKDIAKEVDPMADGKGASRIGNYIKWCLEGLDKNLSQDDILKEANQRYADAFGQNTITHENSFEFQVSPLFTLNN
jgi:hypothetical protein